MTNNILQQIEQTKVEWKTLGEVFDIKNGYTPSKSNQAYWQNGTIPWFRMEDIRQNGRVLNSAIQNVHESGVKGKLFPANSIMLSTTATIGEHALVTVDYLSNQQISNFSIKKEYQNNLDVKFVFYYFFIIAEQAKKNINNSSMPSVQMGALKNFQIPIPPLSLQHQIAEILDKMTALTSELTSELNLRQKQYQYYRDKLLTFGDEVEWKSLGEIAKVVDGTHTTPKYLSSGVPFVSVENIKNLKNTKKFISQEAFDKYKIKPMIGDIFMTRIGDIGTCAIVEDNEPLAYYVTLALIRLNDNNILPKYIKFFIESGFGKSELYKRTLVNAVPIKINLGDISKIKIPIPPLETQNKIVAILDKFDTLTNSLTDGLPREIELRQKQYEYYRERLLDFRKS